MIQALIYLAVACVFAADFLYNRHSRERLDRLGFHGSKRSIIIVFASALWPITITVAFLKMAYFLFAKEQ